ncbi:MAG: hypothetical protein WCC10_04240 [Tumebacillaceae bacterium]
MAVYTSLSFYVQAHPDDWQLFRGEVAHDDLNYPDSKVVFVCLTQRQLFSAPSRRALYLGYVIGRMPVNLPQSDYDKKMIQLVQENGQTPPVQEFQNEWNEWGMRSYSRLLQWFE